MTKLFSRQRGTGKPIIFLHGFPMHQGIWDEFGDKFIAHNTVVSVDLPGFGKSPSLSPGFTLEHVADAVIAFVEDHKFSGAVLVGHSLGGYVSLAMIENRPDLFDALILFHSTALPDTAERKASRNKVIESVERNGALPFTSGFIAPLFVDQQHEGIERMKEIAATTPADTVIGYTKAMRDRKDYVKTLRSFEKPTLLIAGEKDQGISVSSVYDQAKGCKNAEIEVIENVAHMGMVEKSIEAESRIKDFLKKI
jgi:pimeloyl-ACP methyl ester carboxylesterase